MKKIAVLFFCLLVSCLFLFAGCAGGPKPSDGANADGGEIVGDAKTDGGVTPEKGVTKEAPKTKEDDGLPYTGKPCTNDATCKARNGADLGYICLNAKCVQQDIPCDIRTQATTEKNLTCMVRSRVCVPLGTTGTGLCKDPYCANDVPANFTASKTRCKAPASSKQKCPLGQILMGYFACIKNGVIGNDPVDCRDKNGGYDAFDCVSDNPFTP